MKQQWIKNVQGEIYSVKQRLLWGDHLNQPMIFSVVSKTLTLCLMTQFYYDKEESATLHLSTTMANCISIFCVLGQMHSKGYLHNDLKQ